MQQNETNTRKENTIPREQLLPVDNSEGDGIMDNNNIGRLRDSPKENNQLQVDKAHGDNVPENSVNDTVGKENYMMLEDKPLDETEAQGYSNSKDETDSERKEKKGIQCNKESGDSQAMESQGKKIAQTKIDIRDDNEEEQSSAAQMEEIKGNLGDISPRQTAKARKENSRARNSRDKSFPPKVGGGIGTRGWIKCITNGASRGSPGRSSWGFCVRNDNGDIVQAQAEEIEDTYCTNSQAEAMAIIQALRYVNGTQEQRVIIETDSMQLEKVIQKTWKVPWKIVTIIEEIWEIMSSRNVRVVHVTREGNKLADYIANRALDQGKVVREKRTVHSFIKG
ncbi:hypothetical protein HAX54_022669 [Datura stramonium]|uniref:RNase H type-1 domain-containing protein n=1 Tax=Datura stramonium TaxID=4076 RepID=A0ABS8S536_DATST|nr:hypothetical protein [Datura stramonium]